MNDNRVSHYFARGNTAYGAHFLYESAFRDLDKIIMLTGPDGTGKSTTIQRAAEHLIEQGQHVQCFHSPLRPEQLDGIIATEWKIGIVDAAACQGVPKQDATEVIAIDFGTAIDEAAIKPEHAERIASLSSRLANAYSSAYQTYQAALRIHDEWERYYIANTDFEKADQLAQAWSDDLFGGHAGSAPAAGRHLFFGAATPKGAFDFIQRLTASLPRRIFIKGRPGSGKSTFLKKLSGEAENRGVDVQIFHCGLDPNSLDMLIFPKLGTAIFDSTSPHEYFPEREGDEILDLYALTVAPGTDEAHADALAAIRARYSAAMKEAAAYLASAEAIDAQIKSIYTSATDFSVVERLRRQLQSELYATSSS